MHAHEENDHGAVVNETIAFKMICTLTSYPTTFVVIFVASNCSSLLFELNFFSTFIMVTMSTIGSLLFKCVELTMWYEFFVETECSHLKV